MRTRYVYFVTYMISDLPGHQGLRSTSVKVKDEITTEEKANDLAQWLMGRVGQPFVGMTGFSLLRTEQVAPRQSRDSETVEAVKSE